MSILPTFLAQANVTNVTASNSLNIAESIRSAGRTFINDAINFIPKVVVGVVIFTVGYFIASFVAKTIKTTFEKTGLNDLISKSAIGNTMSGMGLKSPIGELLSKIVNWLLILFSLRTAANAADLNDISSIVLSIFQFLPKAFVATIITVIGFMVADIVKNAVSRALTNYGVDYANALSKILFGFVIILVLTSALKILNIETELLNDSVKILLGGVAIAFSLALGLGLKNLASSMVSGVYARDLYKPGTMIQYEGQECEVAGVGPVTTKLLTRDGSFIIVPNTKLINESITGRKP